jgi:hypothetical protein
MVLAVVSMRNHEREPSSASSLGCLLVLAPFLAFFIVWPDALHVWPKPWANLPLWIVGAVVVWLGLRLLLMRAATLRAWTRTILYCGLVAASAVASYLIATSVYF